MTLELGDLAVIGGMVGGMMAIPLTLIVFNLKTLTKRVESVECRIDKLGKEKAEKYEWAREAFATRGRLTAIGEKLERFGGQLDANFGVAVSVNRLTEAVEKWRSVPNAH